jgi:hypothetical protein
VSNTQLLEQSPRQRPNAPRYWIITKHDPIQLRGLTIPLSSGEEALVAFSFNEEAELFLKLGQEVREGWQIRESSAGEIISLLMGPHVDVGRVALDPAPEMLAQKLGGLVSLDRERFMDIILNRGS